MQDILVSYYREDGIGWLTVSNPPVNSLNRKVMDQLERHLVKLAEEDDFQVLVVTGEGERAFVGGADIKEFPELDYQSGRGLVARGQDIFSRLAALPFPTIAAINGFALGGGCELALACDMRVMAEEAILGQPEVGLGLIPGYGGTQRLPRLIGAGLAKELIFTGETIGAERALAIGLVNRVVPGQELEDACSKLAAKILQKGPQAIKKAKEAVDKGLEMELQEGLSLEADLFGQLCATEDKNEGVNAFIEKRKPEFTGK
ncbi:MAG: enoyl-CoA hydratase-related protein [Halanaerobium sp.]|nr:enoyl-CoA hydratase-related protein [Halanaerobium sp.]